MSSIAYLSQDPCTGTDHELQDVTAQLFGPLEVTEIVNAWRSDGWIDGWIATCDSGQRLNPPRFAGAAVQLCWLLLQLEPSR